MRLIKTYAFICVTLLGYSISNSEEIPKLSQRVTDLTATLSSSELNSLETELRTFEQTTSTQIVVVMVPSIGEGAIEEVALRIAEENGVGQKGKNNGVVLFIAKGDRQIRIEVGYGLEGALPDALAGQIIRKEIVPWFKRGSYYEGIRSGIQAIMLATKNEYKADDSSPHSFLPLILVFIILFFIFRGIGGRRRLSVLGVPFYASGFGRSSGGGGWSGGGFSGGGGSFGGGGASGGW